MQRLGVAQVAHEVVAGAGEHPGAPVGEVDQQAGHALGLAGLVEAVDRQGRPPSPIVEAARRAGGLPGESALTSGGGCRAAGSVTG